LSEEVLLRVAAKAVIRHEGRILLLRESSTYTEGVNGGRYHFPGGRIEADEPFNEALSREVAEETGLKVEMHQPLYIGEWWPEIKGVKNHIIAVFMECQADDIDLITLSDEHDEYIWLDTESLEKIDIMTPDKQVAETALGVN